MFSLLPGRLGNRYQHKLQKKLKDRPVLAEFAHAVHMSRNKTCIDLGANRGRYTRQMARKAKKVIAFEPDPWTHAKLRARLARFRNVTLLEAAAGTSDTTVQLYRNPEFHLNPKTESQVCSVVKENPAVAEGTTVEVRQINFIRFLEGLDEEIGVIKIDIEGAEFELLEALLDHPEILGRIDHIFVETHEFLMPEYQHRANSLRERVRGISRPRINLEWP